MVPLDIRVGVGRGKGTRRLESGYENDDVGFGHQCQVLVRGTGMGIDIGTTVL